MDGTDDSREKNKCLFPDSKMYNFFKRYQKLFKNSIWKVKFLIKLFFNHPHTKTSAAAGGAGGGGGADWEKV